MYNIYNLNLNKLKHLVLFLVFIMVLFCSLDSISNRLTFAAEQDIQSTESEILELFDVACDWSSKNADARKTAIEKLADIGPDSIKILVWKLETRDVMKRVTLYEIINKVGNSASEYLSQGLTSESENVRYRCADLIGETGSTNATDSLRTLLLHERSERVLPFALKSLGQVGDASDVALISSFMNHESETVRRNVASALGKINDPSAVSILIELLDDELFSVRYPALEALINIGEPAFESVVNYLDSANESRSVGMALDFFSSVGNEKGIVILFDYLKSDNNLYARYSAIALGNLKNTEYLPDLKLALKNTKDPLIGYHLKQVIDSLEKQDEEQ